MQDNPQKETARYWAGLGFMESLVEPDSELTTPRITVILGAKNVTCVGAALILLPFSQHIPANISPLKTTTGSKRLRPPS